MISAIWLKIKGVVAAAAAFFAVIAVTFLTGRGYGKRAAERKRAEIDSKAMTDDVNAMRKEQTEVRNVQFKVDGESRADLDKHDDKWMRD